jgi:hypothetical protein
MNDKRQRGKKGGLEILGVIILGVIILMRRLSRRRRLSAPSRPFPVTLCWSLFTLPLVPVAWLLSEVFFSFPALSVRPHSFDPSRICLSSTKFLFSLFFSLSCPFSLILLFMATFIVPMLTATNTFIASSIFLAL